MTAKSVLVCPKDLRLRARAPIPPLLRHYVYLKLVLIKIIFIIFRHMTIKPVHLLILFTVGGWLLNSMTLSFPRSYLSQITY